VSKRAAGPQSLAPTIPKSSLLGDQTQTDLTPGKLAVSTNIERNSRKIGGHGDSDSQKR